MIKLNHPTWFMRICAMLTYQTDQKPVNWLRKLVNWLRNYKQLRESFSTLLENWDYVSKRYRLVHGFCQQDQLAKILVEIDSSTVNSGEFLTILVRLSQTKVESFSQTKYLQTTCLIMIKLNHPTWFMRICAMLLLILGQPNSCVRWASRCANCIVKVLRYRLTDSVEMMLRDTLKAP